MYVLLLVCSTRTLYYDLSRRGKVKRQARFLNNLGIKLFLLRQPRCLLSYHHKPFLHQLLQVMKFMLYQSTRCNMKCLMKPWTTTCWWQPACYYISLLWHTMKYLMTFLLCMTRGWKRRAKESWLLTRETFPWCMAHHEVLLYLNPFYILSLQMRTEHTHINVWQLFAHADRLKTS